MMTRMIIKFEEHNKIQNSVSLINLNQLILFQVLNALYLTQKMLMTKFTS